jgi:hypothetical protein
MKKNYSTTRSDYLRFLRNSQNEKEKKKKDLVVLRAGRVL